MRVLNIHGYKGSSENSAARAWETFDDVVVISLSIDYDALSPTEIFRELKKTVKEDNIDVICGTSLGGFFAALLCERFELPTLLINPALLPEVLLPELGYDRPYGAREFRDLNLKYMRDLDLRYVSTIIGTEDEVITTLDHTRMVLKNSRFVEVDGGKHSGSTLNLEAILRKYRKEWFDDLLTKAARF